MDDLVNLGFPMTDDPINLPISLRTDNLLESYKDE